MKLGPEEKELVHKSGEWETSSWVDDVTSKLKNHD